MSEHSPTRPAIEPRRASESVADNGTRTAEERGRERQSTSGTRARSTGANRQLARQPPASARHVVRGVDEAVAPTQHPQDRKGAPAVRLDMDLDVEIDLKAKIRGDLELSILDSEQTPR
ncbi:uncharacterized protein B0T15DRAFT_497542 [Chaetomium strumarium]|uniref:Uncharacterized protein n=1 Tax=Chaetomium strumarium TaxID=1170767 RepID=A0AAJ0GKZ4_9PEZI|nr:hypothetical protein B0T15DRAFT_497542 [Chaetomium strumarium]